MDGTTVEVGDDLVTGISIEERLNALAREIGRPKTALARMAILEYIDDLEDYYLAESRSRKNRKTTCDIPRSGVKVR